MSNTTNTRKKLHATPDTDTKYNRWFFVSSRGYDCVYLLRFIESNGYEVAGFDKSGDDVELTISYPKDSITTKAEELTYLRGLLGKFRKSQEKVK